MDKYQGMGYDAVGIEHSFAIFLQTQVGARGKNWDADIFRNGNRKEIGKALQKVCIKYQQRISSFSFSQEDSRGGGIKARLDSTISSINDIAKEMENSKDKEPFDYHWLIIGDLLLGTTSLLDFIEKYK